MSRFLAQVTWLVSQNTRSISLVLVGLSAASLVAAAPTDNKIRYDLPSV